MKEIDVSKIHRCRDCEWASVNIYHTELQHGCQNPIVNAENPKWLGGDRGVDYIAARRPDPRKWRAFMPRWTRLHAEPSPCGLDGKQFLPRNMARLVESSKTLTPAVQQGPGIGMSGSSIFSGSIAAQAQLASGLGKLDPGYPWTHSPRGKV